MAHCATIARILLPRDVTNLAVTKDGSRSPPEQEQLTQDFVPQGSQDVAPAIYIEIF
jgi:hypothetical protein